MKAVLNKRDDYIVIGGIKERLNKEDALFDEFLNLADEIIDNIKEVGILLNFVYCQELKSEVRCLIYDQLMGKLSTVESTEGDIISAYCRVGEDGLE